MAMFYFRLKSDKKPNETKISAVKHVDYILGKTEALLSILVVADKYTTAKKTI